MLILSLLTLPIILIASFLKLMRRINVYFQKF